MPTGAGVAGAGMTIAGYGGVDAGPVQQQKILIDADSGSAREARKIDPVTGRYVFDSLGRVQGMGGVQQLVLMRAKTLLDSSVIKGLGLAAPSGVVLPHTIRILTDAINAAMKDIVDAGLIRVLEVHVEKLPGSHQFFRYFRWKDLTASANQSGEEKTNF